MRQNLDFIRGQTETFSGILRDSTGAAVDLTNAVLTWKIGGIDRCLTRVTLTEGDGITVTTGTGGQWSISVAPTKTADLRAGDYVHQGEAAIGAAVYGITDGRLTLRGDLPNQ